MNTASCSPLLAHWQYERTTSLEPLRWQSRRFSLRHVAESILSYTRDAIRLARKTTEMDEPKVLVINCGSSSLKFAVIAPQQGVVLRHGLAERLGSARACLRIGTHAEQLSAEAGPSEILGRVLSRIDDLTVRAVGHRVVHGGESFSDSVPIDAQALLAIESCIPLAPLHNPANLAGIHAAQSHLPDIPQIAVFDTAFHQTLPPKAYFYGVPYELYEKYRVRRYGFHGTSHSFVANEAARSLERPLTELQLVTAHLGNGCSTCAIFEGKSVDTSMGLTPLEGLMMGTRSGDVDPNLHQFISQQTGRTLDEITDLLNRDSGLLGLSTISNDMRTLLATASSEPHAALAIDVFCYRLARSILGLCAALDRLDALVFTGGIGEHAAVIRAKTLRELRFLGFRIDEQLNRDHGKNSRGHITHATSPIPALVIPTNEELEIAREVLRFV